MPGVLSILVLHLTGVQKRVGYGPAKYIPNGILNVSLKCLQTYTWYVSLVS